MKSEDFVEVRSGPQHATGMKQTIGGLKARGQLCVGKAAALYAMSHGIPSIGSASTPASKAALTCELPREGTRKVVVANYGFDEVVALGILELRQQKRTERGDDVELLDANPHVKAALKLAQMSDFDRREPLTTPLLKLRFLVEDRRGSREDLLWFVSRTLYYFVRGEFPQMQLLDTDGTRRGVLKKPTPESSPTQRK